MQSDALRLDYTITYFQLNSFLVDNFFDSEYFCRMSRLDSINDVKPAPLMVTHLHDLECKLKSLELIK